MRTAAVLVLSFALASCDGAAPTAVDPCTARLSEMRARLSRLAAADGPVGAPTGVALPSVDRGEPVGRLPLLVVSSDEVTFGGRGVGGLEGGETAATLTRDLRAASDLAGEEPLLVGLWAAPETSMETLAELLSHAPPGVSFALLVRGPDVAGPEAPSWIREALGRLDPPPEGEGIMPGISAVSPETQRRMRIAESWPRATEGCPAARGGMLLSAETGALREPVQVSRIMDALGTCGCEDADGIEALVAEAVRSLEGPLLRLPVRLRFGLATGGGEELTRDAGSSVTQLVGVLADRPAGDAPLWIRVD